ncbi:MAG: electron transfer flavoprotein beta subunit/FixA family protein, partial [Bdellovibrionales bacterium]|nr:electron transfer flavoprotein beta subunit/FixA family protein [Bdellovibrionales bacterium]
GSLPGIMKAKKNTLKVMTFAELGLEGEKPRIQYEDYQLPPEKPPVKMIEGTPEAQAKELVRLLKEEAKVL